MNVPELNALAHELRAHHRVTSVVVDGFGNDNYVESDSVGITIRCTSIPERLRGAFNHRGLYLSDVEAPEPGVRVWRGYIRR